MAERPSLHAAMARRRPQMRLALLLLVGVVGAVSLLAAPASGSTPFRYMSYIDIVHKLQALANQYPRYLKVFSAQETYGVGSPGTCSPNSDPCEHWFAHVTDHSTMPDEERPEVFFSGNLHGDEQVGPMTLINLVEYLVKMRTDGTNPWINYLVDSRSIYMIPVTNPYGYYRNIRTEYSIDPNRDFPYMVGPTQCMRTFAARAMNEIWRDHLFQLAVTFHGGMQAIGYEWGSPNHQPPNDITPDDPAQAAIAVAMRDAAGRYQGDVYPVGPMNDIVYAVTGGFEDWAYAASWDAANVKQCTVSGYDKSKTIYTDSMLRAFNIIVEAWDAKKPAEAQLGTNADILAVAGDGDGHVPRNMRLSLALIESLQPYVLYRGVSVVTRAKRNLRGAQAAVPTRRVLSISEAGMLTKSVSHVQAFANASSNDGVYVTVDWTVGGGFNVDETNLVWTSWTGGQAALDSPRTAQEQSWQQFMHGLISEPYPANATELLSGATLLKAQSAINRGITPLGNEFHACVQLPAVSGQYLIVARAKLDQTWGHEVFHAQPAGHGKAHYTNARTNEAWYHQNAGHTIRGRTTWVAKPIIIDLQVYPATNTGAESSSSSSSAGTVTSQSSSSATASASSSQAAGSSSSASAATSSSSSAASSSAAASSGSSASSQDGSIAVHNSTNMVNQTLLDEGCPTSSTKPSSPIVIQQIDELSAIDIQPTVLYTVFIIAFIAVLAAVLVWRARRKPGPVYAAVRTMPSTAATAGDESDREYNDDDDLEDDAHNGSENHSATNGNEDRDHAADEADVERPKSRQRVSGAGVDAVVDGADDGDDHHADTSSVASSTHSVDHGQGVAAEEGKSAAHTEE